jgi:TonB family protein
MTAAALRPDLFSHLFATQREAPAKGDVAATAVSVLFHVGVVVALVWASANLRGSDAPVVTDQPIPIVIADPGVERTNEPAGGGGGGGSPAPQPQYSLTSPDFIPSALPTPSAEPWFEPGSQPIPGPKNGNPGEGTNPGGGETKDGFVVLSVVPALLNQEEVTRALVKSYPAMLRDAGIGGDVMVWLLIDESGRVVETEIKSSSGHAALDQAARNVAGVMRFSPARNRDQQVKVWVSLPIRFRTN